MKNRYKVPAWIGLFCCLDSIARGHGVGSILFVLSVYIPLTLLVYFGDRHYQSIVDGGRKKR